MNMPPWVRPRDCRNNLLPKNLIPNSFSIHWCSLSGSTGPYDILRSLRAEALSVWIPGALGPWSIAGPCDSALSVLVSAPALFLNCILFSPTGVYLNAAVSRSLHCPKASCWLKDDIQTLSFHCQHLVKSQSLPPPLFHMNSWNCHAS